jgi:hypothetical protein
LELVIAKVEDIADKSGISPGFRQKTRIASWLRGGLLDEDVQGETTPYSRQVESDVHPRYGG